MMRVRYVGSWLAMALMLGFLVGCGNKNLGQVSGTVTLDGAPLPDAMVIFTPLEGGRPAAGKTDSGGNYKLIFDRTSTGAELGEHVVEITTGDELEMDDGTMKTIPEKVPAKYNLKTDLRAEIKTGSNVHDFALESGGEIVDAADLESEDE